MWLIPIKLPQLCKPVSHRFYISKQQNSIIVINCKTEIMRILIPIDWSENAMEAFNCKYKNYDRSAAHTTSHVRQFVIQSTYNVTGDVCLDACLCECTDVFFPACHCKCTRVGLHVCRCICTHVYYSKCMSLYMHACRSTCTPRL